MKIYTRTGDEGHTALFGGGRVAKDAARVDAYGEVDELNAAIGLARSATPEEFESELLDSVQRDLFSIGGQLATPDPGKVERAIAKADISDARITALERAIDAATEELSPLRAFVVPGGTEKAARLHLARTVCRRAERAVVSLAASEQVPAIILTYLNRLSDLLFTLARLANRRAGVSDPTW
jgi:cob(I)alamin adenosyltransferase